MTFICWGVVEGFRVCSFACLMRVVAFQGGWLNQLSATDYRYECMSKRSEFEQGNMLNV